MPNCEIVVVGKNDKFTDTENTSGRGNLDNKTEQTNDCDPTGSDKCPPGQFP